MRTHYLGHIVFYVRDLETSLKFYEKVLGLKRIEGGELPFKAAALTSGRTHHELLLIEVGDAPGPPPGPRRGFYHAGFKIGDSLDELKKAYHELYSAGIQVKGMSDHTISKSIYLHDPDGNEIELYVDDPDVDWEDDPAAVLSPIRPLDL
ncbi:MAG: VOC family protein [Candidatus Marinimicrobia bacterium]|jgi:catechol 2,3-dioxygenase|nr:VOC family protein [Candidatus Neomarinimicrobiota bacterium]